MQPNWKTEVDEHKKNCCFELGYQNVDETGLEYVRVEEQQEDNNDRKQNENILNSETVNNNQQFKFSWM